MRFNPRPRKNAGRILSALLAATMIFTSLPQTALSVYAAEAGGTDTSTITTVSEADLPSDTGTPEDPDGLEEMLPPVTDTPDEPLPSDTDAPGETLPSDTNAPDDLISPTEENGDDPTTQFQVTFELSGHGEAIEPLAVDAGGKLENAESLQPTAEGFRFDGWYKDADFTALWDFENDTVTENITLYAKWTALFTVTFSLSGHGEAIEPLTVPAGDKLENAESLQPTAEGYRFDGWYKDELLTEKWNFETDAVTENITLYAKWTAVFTVTFVVTYIGEAIEPLTVDGGSKLEDSEALRPVSEGWHFEGWYKDEQLTEKWDFNRDTVTQNIILYAKWQEMKAGTHVVTFNLSGQGPDFYQYPASGSMLEIPEDPQPAEVGYSFSGWYKDRECTQPWSFETDAVTADITLYAKWTEIFCTVTFDFQGQGTNITQSNIKYGSLLTQTSELAPTADGFLFLGWYKDASFSEVWDFAADTVIADITLYAFWQKVYTVTFDLGGKGTNIVKSNIYEGALLSRTEDLTPAAEGFHFEGWYQDSAFTKIWNFDKDTVTSNLTLYAKWKELKANQCTVTFCLSGHGPDFYDYVDQDTKLTEPEEPQDEGWQFLNWYIDEEFTEAWDFREDTVTANLTLYARWAQLTSLQVSAIPSQPFTGKAIKPAISVYFSEYNDDGEESRTLLRANKDYKVSYVNNTNTNAYAKEQALKNGRWEEDGDTLTGGSSSTGTKVTGGFHPALPHIIVEGKGNYRGKLYMNFEITQISIGEGGESAAAGISLQCNDQFPIGKPNKDQKTISSFKYLKNNLKENTDYTAAIEGAQATGSVISRDDPIFDRETGGGDCTLTLTGCGNYTGSIVRQVIVREKGSLLKNAKISLGSKCKSKPLGEEEGEVTLIPAYYEEEEEEVLDKNGDPKEDADGNPITRKKTVYKQYINGDWVTGYEVYDENKDDYVTKKLDKNNAFTVKVGSTWLKYGEDYDIVYANNTSVGTATMTIKGIGEYTGSKSVTFKITKASSGSSGGSGKKFNADTIKISGWVGKMSYTGSEVTQSVSLETKKSTKIYDCGMEQGEEEEYEKPNGDWGTRKHKHNKNCDSHVEVEHAFEEGEYTVTYKNNIRVGTATAIFTANPESGYSGSFKKTFKITGIDMAEFVTFEGNGETLEPDVIDEDIEVDSGKKDEDGEPIMTEKHIHKVNKTRTMTDTTVPYAKSGATLNFSLTSSMGTLELNRDYTISYKNHKNITKIKRTKIYEEEEDDDGKIKKVWTGDWDESPDPSKMGALTIKGKGNYSGTLTIKYQIVQGTMDTDGAVVTVARSAYSPSTKEYKPKVTVWTPNAGTLASNEYTVKYSNNKKDAVAAYRNGEGEAPTVTVTFKKNNNYSNLCDEKDEDGNVTKYEPISLDPVTMEFYPNKLTAKNLYIIIDNENPKELVYTGKQVTNVRLRVYYGSDAAVKAAKKNKITNHRLLTAAADAGGQYGLIRLQEALKDDDGNISSEGDYTLTYGKNNAVGKNKGSITVNGTGEYGGSVSQKFQIYQKPVYYSVVANDPVD